MCGDKQERELTFVVWPHGVLEEVCVGLVAAVAQHPQLEYLPEFVRGDPQRRQDHHSEPIC